MGEHVSDLDNFCSAFTDGVKQRLLDTLKVNAIEQKFDGFHGLAVDGQVEGATAHVVETVDVQRDFVGFFEWLTNDGHVAQRCRVQVHPLLVCQL